jgi:hypothetical protein
MLQKVTQLDPDVHACRTYCDKARLRDVKRPVEVLAIGLGPIVLVFIVLALDVARFGGAFRAESGFAGKYREIAPGGSSEDIQINRERGIAYLSVQDRATLHGSPGALL